MAVAVDEAAGQVLVTAGNDNRQTRAYHGLTRALPEPFGLVAAEAMACGTPAVAFRGSGPEEIVEDGVTGFLADAGSAVAPSSPSSASWGCSWWRSPSRCS